MKTSKCLFLAILLNICFISLALATNQPTDASVLTKSTTINTDIIIKTKLLTTYSLNSVLHKYNIVVDVNNGIVHLDGAVQNEPEKELAINIAKDIESVQTVTDSIVVDKNTKAGEITSDYGQKVYDATLTAMVKSRLLLNPKVSALNIKVTTVNDITTLEGEVPSLTAKQIAGRIAIKTPGVAAVKNNLQIKAKGNSN